MRFDEQYSQQTSLMCMMAKNIQKHATTTCTRSISFQKPEFFPQIFNLQIFFCKFFLHQHGNLPIRTKLDQRIDNQDQLGTIDYRLCPIMRKSIVSKRLSHALPRVLEWHIPDIVSNCHPGPACPFPWWPWDCRSFRFLGAYPESPGRKVNKYLPDISWVWTSTSQKHTPPKSHRWSIYLVDTGSICCCLLVAQLLILQSFFHFHLYAHNLFLLHP